VVANEMGCWVDGLMGRDAAATAPTEATADGVDPEDDYVPITAAAASISAAAAARTTAAAATTTTIAPRCDWAADNLCVMIGHPIHQSNVRVWAAEDTPTMFVPSSGSKETICLRRVLQRPAEAIICSTNNQKSLPPPHEVAQQSLFPPEALLEDLLTLLL
jgi:hypothetical protein